MDYDQAVRRYRASMEQWERQMAFYSEWALEDKNEGPKVDDPARKEEEQKAPQTVPRISGGPELNEAELSEDDDKRPDKK